MASMTDYQILHDGSFELSGNLDSKVMQFTFPDDFTVGTNRGKPILAFLINPRSDSVRVHAGVNSPQLLQSESDVQLTFTNPPHFDFALWEAISGTKFNPGETNTCHFITVGSSSRVRVRDVVLWYQRGAGG